MTTFEIDVPLKQRNDLIERLGDAGLTAEIDPQRDTEGNECLLTVIGGVKDVQTTIVRVMREMNLSFGDEDEE